MSYYIYFLQVVKHILQYIVLHISHLSTMSIRHFLNNLKHNIILFNFKLLMNMLIHNIQYIFSSLNCYNINKNRHIIRLKLVEQIHQCIQLRISFLSYKYISYHLINYIILHINHVVLQLIINYYIIRHILQYRI